VLAVEVREQVAWIRLDRPAKRNAMTRAFWGELRAALDDVRADDAVRAVVFCGAGACFSAGGDIEGFGELDGAAERRRYAEDALFALRAVEELPKPTIAAVHGAAYGGGCELTMVCDLVVADETARFATPEATIGLFPGLAVVRGHAVTGGHWLKYLVLTGEPLGAHDARLAGLVNVVTPAGEHLAEAERLARLAAARAPLALALAKRILGRSSADGYGHAIDAVALLQGSDDVAEGIAAFAERRPPRFEGR
jgi:enoyl-CoA hydratase/carnithine racemase